MVGRGAAGRGVSGQREEKLAEKRVGRWGRGGGTREARRAAGRGGGRGHRKRVSVEGQVNGGDGMPVTIVMLDSSPYMAFTTTSQGRSQTLKKTGLGDVTSLCSLSCSPRFFSSSLPLPLSFSPTLLPFPILLRLSSLPFLLSAHESLEEGRRRAWRKGQRSEVRAGRCRGREEGRIASPSFSLARSHPFILLPRFLWLPILLFCVFLFSPSLFYYSMLSRNSLLIFHIHFR